MRGTLHYKASNRNKYFSQAVWSKVFRCDKTQCDLRLELTFAVVCAVRVK